VEETEGDRSDQQLSDIEVSVLRLITEGTTNRTIACTLGISVHDVTRVLEALWHGMDGMDDSQLLPHLRSVHRYKRRRVPEPEKLRRWHLFAHSMNTRVGRAALDAGVDRERSA